MKKIIPFNKEMLFNDSVFEITSISLEHDLKVSDNNLISGKFYINGEYKISDVSINTEIFKFELPCDINLDSKYILDNVKIDIDDFYYEVINSNILKINIDVLIDRLEEKKEIEVPVEEIRIDDNLDNKNNDISDDIIDDSVAIKTNSIEELENDLERESDGMETIEKERCIEDEDINSVKSIFGNFTDTTETYKTYKVYIVREGDNLESIIQKYSVSKDILEKYNNINEINIGDKIIIPSLLNEKN